MLIELVTANGALLVAAAGMSLCLGAMFSSRRSLQGKIDELESHLNDMSSELKSVSHGSMGMGRKLQTLGQMAVKLNDTVTEIQKNDPNKVSYSEAARLVNMGAGVDDLMNACGISRPEAELVTALTKNAQASKPEHKEEIPQLDSRV